VNAHIGRIITALQFDDIARQRIEHVAHGLERLAVLLARGTLSDEEPPAPPETVRLAAGALAALMVRQIVDLAGQLEAAASALARELAATTDQVRRLEPEVDRLAGGDGQRAGSETPLERLDQELGGARSLFAAYADAHQGVIAELARLGDVAAATAATSRALDEVETDIRIVGLNAEIKSARLGDEGTVTKRIAEAVREHAAIVSQPTRRTRTRPDGSTPPCVGPWTTSCPAPPDAGPAHRPARAGRRGLPRARPGRRGHDPRHARGVRRPRRPAARAPGRDSRVARRRDCPP
jgi:hypothetical protein